MSECQTGCGRPTQDMLCADCLGRLRADLRHLPDLYAELVVTLTRQDRLTGQGDRTTGQSETVLPYKPAASEVRWAADNVVSTWARDVAETYPHRPLTATSTPEAAEWLVGVSGLLAEHPAAGELYDEITDSVAQMRRAIDRPGEQIALGECGAEGGTCDERLYSPPQRGVVRCPACGSEWDVRQRSEQLARQLDDQLDTAATIARALVQVGISVTSAMIRGYAHRETIRQYGPHPLDTMARPRYRVGDVLDIVTRQEAD